MAVKAEKMQECNSEVRRNGQQQQLMASEEMLKPEREKRKHLVAASLPSSQLPAHAGGSGCQKSEQSQNLLLTCMMALNILLFSVLLFQKKQPNEQNFVHIDISSSPEQLYAAGKQGLEELPKSLPCSGHGHLITSQQQADASRPASAACKCHACYGGSDCSQAVSECIIDLDHGDPTMYEAYWLANGESSTTVIPGWQRMSYFAHSQQVWFMEHELEVQIRALHAIVGNAITEGRHIVVGTGSTQLYQAALYALSLPEEQTKPISVVSAAPFYSVSRPLQRLYCSFSSAARDHEQLYHSQHVEFCLHKRPHLQQRISAVRLCDAAGSSLSACFKPSTSFIRTSHPS
jgi:hypothetical protein